MTDSARGLFSAAQFHAAYPAGIERHWWIMARTGIVDRLLRAADNRNEPVLEVGCGTGVAVAGLRALGHDCRGVELAAAEPPAALRTVVRAGCDALELPQAERESTRCILLLDVLEHLDDPRAFLAGLATGFPGLRRVIVSVPARPELWSNYDEFFGHRLRYDLPALRALGSVQGWRVRSIGYGFRLSYLPAWLMARFGAARAVKLHGPSGWRVTLHRIAAALTLLEWQVLPGCIPGSSAFACFELP